MQLKKNISLISKDMPLWMLGLSLIILGIIMTNSGASLYQYQADWQGAIITTGRVILTEWRQKNKENRLQVRYAYQDDRGVIYHNGGTLARRLGKLNLEPGAPVVVEYLPQDHSRSRLQLQLGWGEWIPLLVLGVLELAAGVFFIFVCWRRLVSPQPSG